MGMLSQPVVGHPKRLQLSRRKMPDLNDRDLRHPKLLSRKDTSMTNNDLVLGNRNDLAASKSQTPRSSLPTD